MPTTAHLNRSEPLISAALGLLLQDHRLGAPLLDQVTKGWLMSHRHGQPTETEQFDLGGGDLDATALLHFCRDQHAAAPGKGGREPSDSGRTSFREVDVVAWTDRIVLGIEVKVLGSRSRRRLATQLKDQREELVAFATAKTCTHVAQCVLSPVRIGGLGHGINELTFRELREAADALWPDRAARSDLLAAVLRQTERAHDITKHLDRDYRTVGVRELRESPDLVSSCLVGVDGLVGPHGEIDGRLARGRRWWKVTEHALPVRPNWCRLDEVRRALDAALPD